MPITQDRMIALLCAAEDLELALQQASESAEASLASAREGKLSAAAALEALAAQLARPQFLLAQPVETLTTLRLERAHFKRNAKRNRAVAEYQRNRRANAGALPPQPSSVAVPPAASLSEAIKGEIEDWIKGIPLDGEE